MSLLRRLKRINYYSARGVRTWWHRATDWWMMLSLPLAIALVFLADTKLQTESAEELLTLRYGRTGEGILQSWLERDPASAWAIAQPLGKATFFTTNTLRGWPLSTTAIAGPTTVKLLKFHDGQYSIIATPQRNSDELVESLLGTLENERLGGLGDAWVAGSVRHADRWLPFVAQIAIAWIALFLTGVACIHIQRGLLALSRTSKHHRTVKRLGKGICPRCRYSLSGATFPEYCPECGLKIWG